MNTRSIPFQSRFVLPRRSLKTQSFVLDKGNWGIRNCYFCKPATVCFCRHCTAQNQLIHSTPSESLSGDSEEGPIQSSESSASDSDGGAEIKSNSAFWLFERLPACYAPAAFCRYFQCACELYLVIKKGYSR